MSSVGEDYALTRKKKSGADLERKGEPWLAIAGNEQRTRRRYLKTWNTSLKSLVRRIFVLVSLSILGLFYDA